MSAGRKAWTLYYLVHPNVTVGLVVFATLILLQLLLSNRRGSTDKVARILASVRPRGWHFVALQYHGISNRTYAVFVTETMICAAEGSGMLMAPVFLTDRWSDPLFYLRPAGMARYEGIDVESEAFAAIRKANFRLHRDEIAVVEFTDKAKWGMGKVPHSGRLVVSLKDGAKKEFILLGKQDGPGLCERLRGWVCASPHVAHSNATTL